MKKISQYLITHALINYRKYLSILLLTLFFIGVSCSNDEQIDGNFNGEASFSSDAKMQIPGTPEVFVSGILGASGSTIGPGGDLYVPEGAIGQITRINLKTGAKSVFASGLPKAIPGIGIGGATDLVFIGDTAYVLTSLVGFLPGTEGTIGIYRVTEGGQPEIVADLGSFSIANPPTKDFFVALPFGVQFAIEKYHGALLVTDGHLNRILKVTTDGEISIFKDFGNIVPTGLEVSGNMLYMAEAGPIPHLPEVGKVVSLNPNSDSIEEIAVGARLLVDVEFNRGRALFALSQGYWEGTPEEAGKPALPNTGSLVRVNEDGSFSTVVDGLNLPSSVEFKGNTAYIITLIGEIIKVDNFAGPPFGL